MGISALSYPQHESIPPLLRRGMDNILLRKIWEFLRVSELMMLDVISGRPPNPEYVGKGNPDVGHFLHYLHHPPVLLAQAIASDARARTAWSWVAHSGKPTSQISPGYFENALPTGLAGGRHSASSGIGRCDIPDGRTVLALICLLVGLSAKRSMFAQDPYVGVLRGRAGKVRLGIAAHAAGRGEDSAEGLVSAATCGVSGLDCDYQFYLGDPCHAGCNTRGASAGDVTLDATFTGGAGRIFMLNSGSAMCSGGAGYFGGILNSAAFTHQNMTSYFALSYGKWVILGLDTAYYGSAASLYMNGVLGVQQSRWIQEYRRSVGGFEGRKILILTHHAGQDFQGALLTGLHSELTDALGRLPDAWYWAHRDLGVAYSNASAAGRLGIKARCIGAAARSCRLAAGLLDASGHPIAAVDHAMAGAHTDGQRRSESACATVELSEDGGITEKFYVLPGLRQVWQSVNGVRFA